MWVYQMFQRGMHPVLKPFFTPNMQAMLTGGATVGDKPERYYSRVKIEGKPTGVE